MGVITTADRCLERAKDCIKEAHENLRVILDADMEGDNEFRKSYVDTLWEISDDLAKMRRKMNP